MPQPVYFVADDHTLYRRSDSAPDHPLPDEVLSPRGWHRLPTRNPDPFPGYQETSPTTDATPDPVRLDALTEITEQEARRIAADRDLPTTDW